MSTGTFADLFLACAAPNKPGFVIASSSFNPMAFMGGTLVPLPAEQIIPIAINSIGEFEYPNIPGGGGPFTLYVQVAYFDPGQTLGVGFSNAIQLDILP